MSESAGCFDFLRGRRSANEKDEAVVSLEVQQPPPHHGGSEVPADPCFLSSCDFGIIGDHRSPALLDAPPLYSQYDTLTLLDPAVIKTVETSLDSLNRSLRKLSLAIHDHPEIQFEERFAHDTLTAFMASHGFEVTKHYLGLETAWKAEFTQGKGGRVVGVNSEMDALPGIGHGCGHNLIAISGVGVALAIKVALQAHNIPAKVVLLGTPAEEGGGGKAILLQRGGYKEMDICLMSHPAAMPPRTATIGTSLAKQDITVKYLGHAAHAGVAPWEGKNALDAAFLAYANISALRQQIKPEERVHGIMEGKNWAPNVIPDNAKLRFITRAPTRDDVVRLRDRVIACFDAAALATGCRHHVKLDDAYDDLIQNSVLGRTFASFYKERYKGDTYPIDFSASTDFGNVTYEIPALHPAYGIPTQPGGGNHTKQFTRSARTEEAHEATILVTKALALTGVKVIKDDGLFEEIKKAFTRQI
ncbi:amidohydrolase [Thelephora ganbajun]|uniref:Amidohydrolase n=1 Tax=Thelephora ganbajun TaxID=370292 RepID=A0ACB6ZCD1_THEGA|nr:amidohydrolase [Thelephora ganbajun]